MCTFGLTNDLIGTGPSKINCILKIGPRVLIFASRSFMTLDGRKYCMCLLASNFFLYKSSYRFRYLDCCQILYLNATDLKLGSSTYLFLLFLFLVLTKCQVLNLRVGRSHDQVLQRAYWPTTAAVDSYNH